MTNRLGTRARMASYDHLVFLVAHEERDELWVIPLYGMIDVGGDGRTKDGITSGNSNAQPFPTGRSCRRGLLWSSSAEVRKQPSCSRFLSMRGPCL
jgi:hypothetical protein